eukprot:Anaeramoba_ignava/c20959_g1_i4.p1 GENE.c20959_g1_i4~~c20959_g1_i4.p1  ORF type:complete len:484 (-),score=170.22 c20959_g1_i4:446-1897(-)
MSEVSICIKGTLDIKQYPINEVTVEALEIDFNVSPIEFLESAKNEIEVPEDGVFKNLRVGEMYFIIRDEERDDIEFIRDEEPMQEDNTFQTEQDQYSDIEFIQTGDNMDEDVDKDIEEIIEKTKNTELAPSQKKTTFENPENIAFIQTQIAELPDIIMKIYSSDIKECLDSTTKIRRMLSMETNPPIQAIIESGVVSRLVEFLSLDDHPDIQFEAAWALTNVASGNSEQTRIVIESGAVPYFIKLLKSPDANVREQSIWALGNIAGDSSEHRDYILNFDLVENITGFFNNQQSLSLLRNAVWAISNFCRGKPKPKFERISKFIPILAAMLHSTDTEILTDSCWGLSYLTDGNNRQIQAVIDADVVPKLVNLVNSPQDTISTPALRTLGNIVSGDDSQTQLVLENGFLNAIPQLLRKRKQIRKEACWNVSNITAGTPAQIQMVIDANIIPIIVEILATDEKLIRQEAAWVICNGIAGGTSNQIL